MTSKHCSTGISIAAAFAAFLLFATPAHAGNKSGCTPDSTGHCRADSGDEPAADPCKSGNCGLEYKSRGSGGSNRSVLRMNFGKTGGRRHGSHHSGRSGKGRFHFKR